MCGIFGFFDRRGVGPGQGTLEAMGDVLRHRGPDDQGVWLGAGVGLGNQRLSIIDVAHGHQPMFSDDGRIVVVQNGEIFNHVELAEELTRHHGVRFKTRSDTEVILRLYETHGADFVDRLNGMFAIAIYDARRSEMLLYRDRVGIKPLFIHDDGVRLYFASEIKALLRAGIPCEPDLLSVDRLLTFNYVPPPATLFKGVKHLPPAHRLRISADGRQMHRWWSLSGLEAEQRSEEQWSEELLALLDDAVRLRMRADVPVGAFLSGGVDSSTVVALMAGASSEPVRSYGIGFHEPKYDETPFAEEAARRVGAHHVSERVDPDMLDRWPQATWFCDQAHGDVSFLPTWRVAELAARDLKVVLTGDGGDELFAGYDKYRDFFARRGVGTAEQTRQAYVSSITLFSREDKEALYSGDLLAGYEPGLARSEALALMEQAAGMDSINQALYLDMVSLLPGNNLVKPDRMGMAASLEARTPFLDYRMMELAFRMPGEMKLRHGETKYLLKKAVTPLIGESLAYRKKQMFTVPVGEWFKDRLYPWAQGTLLSEAARARGLFDPVQVQRVLDDHRDGRVNYTRHIRVMLALEMWFGAFFGGME